MDRIILLDTKKFNVLAIREMGIREERFGARLQILMYVKSETICGNEIVKLKKDCTNLRYTIKINVDNYPNIITSYLCRRRIATKSVDFGINLYFNPTLKIRFQKPLINKKQSH